MRQVGEPAGVAQEDVRQDLQPMFRGASRLKIRAAPMAARARRLEIPMPMPRGLCLISRAPP